MSSDTTTPAEDLPPGWAESPSEALHQWIHTDHGVIVSIQELSPGALVLVEQYVSDNGLTSRVLTHGASFDEVEHSIYRALDLMTEISDGQHLVECICAVEHDDAVDFVAVYPEEIPETIGLEEIANVVNTHLGDGDPATLDEDATEFTGEDMVTIDVFPRPDTHIAPTDSIEVGDATTIDGETAVTSDDA